MANPMMQQLSMSRLSPLKNMINAMRGNPQMMLNQMAQSNPAIKQVYDYVNANGGDPRAAFYKLANERGVDPNEILSMLK